MDEKIIDELYEIYCSNDIYNAERMLNSAYLRSVKKHGKNYLINNIKEYINQKASILPMLFESCKKEEFELNGIKDICFALRLVATAVDNYLSDLELKEYGSIEQAPFVLEHDLLTMNINTIKAACNKYLQDDKVVADKVITLLEYINKRQTLKTLFPNTDWRTIPFDELIYMLYDYHNKNLDIFNFKMNDELKDLREYEDEIWGEFRFFSDIKRKCDQSMYLNFVKYRPNLISKKSKFPQLEEIIFCRNFLEYLEKDMMPDRQGFMYDYMDLYVATNTISKDLSRVYSSKFDLNSFKEKQSNFICNPDCFKRPEKIVARKKVSKGKSFAAGYLLAPEDMQVMYLLHIYIEDVNVSDCNYEIQLNVLPDAKIEHRLQLLRVDNWKNQQTHKNIAKKLDTTTHIHLYNWFDLLRGKTNGSFDIAYNIEHKSTEFNMALSTFLQIINLRENLERNIHSKILQSIEESKTDGYGL